MTRTRAFTLIGGQGKKPHYALAGPKWTIFSKKLILLVETAVQNKRRRYSSKACKGAQPRRHFSRRYEREQPRKVFMYNKVVLAVLQNVLSVHQRPLHRNLKFRTLGASQQEVNWILFETERRLDTQLPDQAITQESTIKDLLKTVVISKKKQQPRLFQ